MRLVSIILAALIVLFAAGWLALHRPVRLEPAEAAPVEISEFGARTAANLIGIQPYLVPADYRSGEALKARLAGYLETARAEGLLTERSIVILPEHTGTWLVAAGAPDSVLGAETVTGAMVRLAGLNPVAFAGAFAASEERDRPAAAIFRSRSRRMAGTYTHVFSELARSYGVTLVAGSIVLPDPMIRAGEIVVNRTGPLYNVSAVFGPDGQLHAPLVRKAYPIPYERGFTAGAPVSLYPVFDTPAGRLGVLICADSWHPDVYGVLDAKGADLLAVPAFLQPSGVWDAPWNGYSTPWPDDVDPADAGRLSEGEAWQIHALAGRLAGTNARAGVTTFLRGALWDLGSDGRAILADETGTRLGPDTHGPAISVLWVEEAG